MIINLTKAMHKELIKDTPGYLTVFYKPIHLIPGKGSIESIADNTIGQTALLDSTSRAEYIIYFNGKMVSKHYIKDDTRITLIPKINSYIRKHNASRPSVRLQVRFFKMIKPVIHFYTESLVTLIALKYFISNKPKEMLGFRVGLLVGMVIGILLGLLI